MRRLVLPVVGALGLLALGAGPASAEPAPAGGTKAVSGKKVCTIESQLLNELSGLVATEGGYVVVNDGTDSDAKRKVFFLDKKCGVVDSVSFPNVPRDPEDLALSPDGKTLWIADIGDNVTNTERRATIALWTMPVDGSKRPVIHRLTYPEGDGPHDAEALLLTPDNTPIVVTKEIGRSGLYMPTAALKANNTEGVPLRRVGEFTVPASTTPTGFIPGRVTVTGGAVAPGGGRVVLRTYSDAYEWDVTNGDIAAAVTNKPRVTPLPDEPFGEAIAYSPDGKSFLTVSDLGDFEGTDNVMLRYAPATQVVTASANQPGGKTETSSGQSWFDKLSLTDVTYLVAGVGAVGAVLVGLGIVGIVRGRRRPAGPVGATAAATANATPAAREPRPDRDARTEQIDAVKDDRPPQATGKGPRGSVYGAGPAAASPKKGSVYGGAPPSAAPPSAVPPSAVPPSAVPPAAAPAVPPAAVPPAPPPTAPPRKGAVYGGSAGGDRFGAVYGNPSPPPPISPSGVPGGERQALARPGAGNPRAGNPRAGATYGAARPGRGESYAAQSYEPGYRG